VVYERKNGGGIMKTPITYWGGKQQLAPKVLRMFPKHRVYCEPFFGGGAVFFAKRPAEVEFINDINGMMVNFYRVLKNRPEELQKKIDQMLHSEEVHRHYKFVYDNPSEFDELERAAAIFCLSKQSIFSILGNSWVMSKDRNMKSVTDIDCSMYARRLQRTSIFCRDAVKVIEAVDGEDVLHYCDPPYFNSECGHYDGYSKEDFVRLLDCLAEVKGRFLLSSYPSDVLDEYVEKYGWNCEKIEMNKSAGFGTGVKTEVLTWNYTEEGRQQELVME
jgi:DNA adenine methylase